jgi:catechol 2,3-dioxygenase-like lactoylglutathione lyase family enzyme
MRLVGLLLSGALAFGQNFERKSAVPLPPDRNAGQVVGVNNFIHSVADLDKAIAFYRDTLGLEMKTTPGRAAGPGAPFPLNEALSNLTGTHGAKFRVATFKVPDAGFDLELTEFSGIDKKPAVARNQDPGAATFVVTVRDLDKALAAVKKAGAAVVTVDGAPLSLGGKTRSIFVRDPDGLFVELFQPDPLPATTAPATSNVIAGRFALTVKDTEKTLAFYRDVFGFIPKPGPAFAANPVVSNLVAVPHAEFRMSRAAVPGSSVTWEFVDYKGVDRKPFSPRIPDPGSPAFSLLVTNADALVDSVKAAGGSLVSTGGPLGAKPGSIFVRDPNGFLIELIQRQSTRQ